VKEKEKNEKNFDVLEMAVLVVNENVEGLVVVLFEELNLIMACFLLFVVFGFVIVIHIDFVDLIVNEIDVEEAHVEEEEVVV
jgi:hypothetical protein